MRGRGALGLGVLVGLAGALVRHSLFPRDWLPAPTGPYSIGTTVWTVIDQARPELFTGPGHPRTLTVQAWYPSAQAPGRVEPYLRDRRTFDAMLDYAHAPRWLLRYLAATPTHATTDAPPAEGRFPVVFFATGNMGYRGSNTVQVEELASHGFVVVTFDQPGTVGTALLADGRRIPYHGSAVVKPLVDASLTEPPARVPVLDGTSYPAGIAPYLAADPAVILDRLTAGDAPLGLAAHLDVDRVGAFGMSLGGVTVSQWCATDPRPTACLFLDAPMTQEALDRGLLVPAAWLTRPATDMTSEGWSEVDVRRFADSQRALFDTTQAPAWYAEISGRKHTDLTDAPFGSPLLALAGLTSPGDGRHVHEVMRHVARDFFAHTLAAAPNAGVLDAPPWPDVTVARHP